MIRVLADQKLIQHDNVIARKPADMVNVIEIQESKQLYLRNEAGKNVLYLVLSGHIDLTNKDKPIASLGPRAFLGEFPILNSTLDYTVSAVARDRCVIACLSESKLESLAGTHPVVWRNMARELAYRLANSNSDRKRVSAFAEVKPGEMTIRILLSSLTIPQLAGVISTIAAFLSAVAGVAYKMGAANLLGG